MVTNNPTGSDKLALWRSFEASALLQCPVCRGALKVSDGQFDCLSCSAVFPVESGVPLLMRPEEITSIPDRVMEVFGIPQASKGEVETALTTLTRYRTYSHPEFANFFARFETRDGQAQTTPLAAPDIAVAIEKVECLTQCFPETLRSDATEFRSIRIRNGSERVLYTDERNPLYLSYRIFTKDGEPVAFEGSRSPLPVPLRPGGELTVPVMINLPDALTGQFIVRVYFVLANRPVADNAAASAGKPGRGNWLTALRGGLRSRLHDEKPADQSFRPGGDVQWFDKSPVAELTITAVAKAAEFPAVRRGSMSEFELLEDIKRADDFLSDVIGDLRSHGVSNPRILEVGAGVYPISLRNCDANTTVVVSDISLVMQTLASIMHTNNPAVQEGRVGFTSFDMMYPPFEDGTFDIICICAALHHIPSPDRFLQRLAPMLSAHGAFVALREPCLVNPFEPVYIAELSNGFNEQMFELPEWNEMIARGGLKFDRAVIDFGCSLKFSARVSQLEETA